MLTTATDVPNLSNVNSMFAMFTRTSSANPDVSNWDVSNVTNMSLMFIMHHQQIRILQIGMLVVLLIWVLCFANASSANPDASNWDVSNVTDMSKMLENSNLSVENLTACYENWSQLNLQQNVEFGAGSTKYNSSGQAGRDILVNTYNWSITDGGLV